jgi:hypothetical protein
VGVGGEGSPLSFRHLNQQRNWAEPSSCLRQRLPLQRLLSRYGWMQRSEPDM